MNKEELLKLIESEDITACCAPLNYMNCYGFMKGFSKMRNYFGEYFDYTIVGMIGSVGCQYNNTNKTFKIIKQAYEDIPKFKNIINSWFEKRDNYYKKYDLIIKNISETNNDELIKNYLDFLENTGNVWAEPLITDAMGVYTETELLSEFKNKIKDKNKTSEYLSILCQPRELSFISEEHLSLLKLTILFKENNIQFENELLKHQETYFWIQNSYKTIKVLNKNYFLKKIKDESKKSIGEINKEIEDLSNKTNLVKQQEELLKILSLNKELEEKLVFTRILGNWQDKRKEFCLRSNHYLSLFLELLSKKANISLNDSYYVSPEEIISLIKKEKSVTQEIIDQRKISMVQFVKFPWEESLFSGEKAKEIKNKLDNNYEEVKELKGVVASKNKETIISGKVQIILNPEEESFEKGNILVVSMTRPEYLPIMKKAKAIICDEGGITSHAAIVSREFGIPCIIGTKNSTKVLKDNDQVELNLNSGLIRIF